MLRVTAVAFLNKVTLNYSRHAEFLAVTITYVLTKQMKSCDQVHIKAACECCLRVDAEIVKLSWVAIRTTEA